MFTDPPLARVGLSEGEAQRQGVAARVARLPMSAVLRTQTTGETQGFMKVLVGANDDRILGFTMIGAEAGEVMAAVQMAMLAESALSEAPRRHSRAPDDGGGSRLALLECAASGNTMTSKLAGKVALVTGGSAGIGLGIAERIRIKRCVWVGGMVMPVRGFETTPRS